MFARLTSLAAIGISLYVLLSGCSTTQKQETNEQPKRENRKGKILGTNDECFQGETGAFAFSTKDGTIHSQGGVTCEERNVIINTVDRTYLNVVPESSFIIE